MSTPATLVRYLVPRLEWQVPAHYNIADDVCTKWADGSGRLALIDEDVNGRIRRFSFDQLEASSSRLAGAFTRLGLIAGDRVAVVGTIVNRASSTATMRVRLNFKTLNISISLELFSRMQIACKKAGIVIKRL